MPEDLFASRSDMVSDHVAGDPNCEACWDGWPRSCGEEGCDGLIHANFGDYVGRGDSYGFYLAKECDKAPGAYHEAKDDD